MQELFLDPYENVCRFQPFCGLLSRLKFPLSAKNPKLHDICRTYFPHTVNLSCNSG